MTPRYRNCRRVKKLRSYTVSELSALLEVHKNTVHQWMKSELRTTDHKRPFLIHGSDVIDFFQTSRMKKRRPCGNGQLYCFRCRAAKNPAGAMADYIPLTEKLGNLNAICPDCGLVMYRVINVAKLESVCQHLDIAFPRALARLTEIDQPSLNSDLE